MSLRCVVLAAALALAVALAGTPVLAQEKSNLTDLQDKTIELLNKVEKAIVAIHCKLEGAKPAVPRVPRRGMRRQRGGNYFGTGAVISADGYILTATSVVPPKGRKIKVYFHDGRVLDAALIGYEERNNVVLIKVDASGLAALPLGSSKGVRVGQIAFTFGNPYDCILNDHQVAISMGVVSGIYRLRGDGDYKGRVIETDAALNAGNDGGPLINARGEIVGVLNLSYSYTKWLNVAVPIDQIKLILDDLKENSEISPRYGFSIAREAELHGGVAITKTSRGGPARKAGMRRGDIVLEIDDMPIERADQFAEELTILPPGSEVTFLIRRGDEERVIRLTSGKVVEKRKKPEPEPEPEPEPQPEPEPEPVPAKEEPGTMGLRLTEEEGNPLVISKVTGGGAADEAGIKEGDKLLEINGRKATTLDEAAEILKDLHAGDKVRLLVEREGWAKEIEVTLKKKK